MQQAEAVDQIAWIAVTKTWILRDPPPGGLYWIDVVAKPDGGGWGAGCRQ